MTTAIQLPADPRRIVILRALFLGDLLCATPAFQALRQRFPSAEITLIGLPWACELVERLPSLDRFLPFPGVAGIPEVEADPERTQAFLREMRDTDYDLALQMHGDGRTSNGFVAALGARTSIGYLRLGDDRLTASLPYVADEPEVERWLRLVGLLGADASNTRLEFPTTRQDACRAQALLASLPPGEGPVVGIHAGSSTPLRRWPAERFAALADELVDRWKCRIVLTGTDAERMVTTQVRQHTHAPVLDLAGRTDLGAFAALISRLDLLVTNDTGASHLAAASRTPSVTIFGSTSPYQWASPDRERHLVVDARTYAPVEVIGPAALQELPVEPVLLACERHLGCGLTRSGERVQEMDRTQRWRQTPCLPDRPRGDD